jgi:hypothetical protein
MSRRRIQFGLLLAAGIALLIVGIIGETGRSRELPDDIIESPYGSVAWNHELHARLPDFSCQSCHHVAKAGTTDPHSCLDCHKRLTDPEALVVSHHEDETPHADEKVSQASPAMIAYHNKCIGCHTAVEKGPVGCRECHKLPLQTGTQDMEKLTATDGPESVMLGHIAQKYEPVEFSHADHVNDYTDGCGDCHHHSSDVEAVPSCRACHHTRTTQKGAKLPGLTEAYHGQCIGCHKEADSGPMDCEDCHEEHDPDTKFPESIGPETSKLGHVSAIYDSVEFNHEEHVDYADKCEDCHHHASEIERVPACRECHNRPFTPKGDKKLGLIDAYHSQCVRCHLKMEGPTTCDGCHAVKGGK